MKKIFIILALLAVSCASRKVDVAKEDVKVVIDSVSTVKVDCTYTKQTNLFISETSEELEYKPADTAKPMVINGVKYLNTIITSKKVKKSTIDTTKVKSVFKSNKKVSLNKAIKANKSEKKIDKKANYWMYLWFLIPVVIIIVLEKYGKRWFPFLK